MKYPIRLFVVAVSAFATSVAQSSDRYTIDPSHTYPSFEAPHIGGISIWRGKLDETSGTVTLDRSAKTGNVDIVMRADSIDFGHAKMNESAKGPNLLDAKQFPTIVYKASAIKFDGDVPTEIDGQLTLRGVTRPVPLTLRSFKCIVHPMLKREVCGADAYAQFDRSEFGMSYGVDMVGSPLVKLAIQVEAIKDEEPSAPR